MSTKTKVKSPSKLAHVVLQTNKFNQMRDFYVNFLGGTITHEAPSLVFITYDDEHHRIALIEMNHLTEKSQNENGLAHIAFTFDTLNDLCDAYKQRKALGITPGWCVNHGPTTSMYYRDPDGNQIETQVDNFDTNENATAMMKGPYFAVNPLGTDFDPEDLVVAVERGDDQDKLKIRKEMGPRGPEAIPGIMEKVMSGKVGA